MTLHTNFNEDGYSYPKKEAVIQSSKLSKESEIILCDPEMF